MSDENKDSNVKATVDAVTGLVQAIPVYQDTLQPAAKQIGKALETVSKLVNIALAPIKVAVWGYERIEEFVDKRVSEKLLKVKPENIVSPSLLIAGPTVEALKYAGHDENLRELYANLLATAMDKETESKAHPAFVDIIKNLASEEAMILTLFIEKIQYNIFPLTKNAEKKHASNIHQAYPFITQSLSIKNALLIPSYIDNLSRLGLLEIIEDPSVAQKMPTQVPEIKPLGLMIHRRSTSDLKNRRLLRLTSFGLLFVDNVVKSK